MPDDRPHRGPLTWVTLGLLGFNWLLMLGLVVEDLLAGPVGQKRTVAAAVSLLVIWGPHLLFAAAVWRSRGEPGVTIATLVIVTLNIGLNISVAAALFGGGTAREGTPCCGVWLVSWPMSILAYFVARQTPAPPPEPGDD